MKELKAIIMAGGEGTRLRPLTCDCPKPMLRIMGRPMMEYALELLKRCGIRECGATLGYLPQPIMDYFGNGADFGMNMRWFVEKTPLGTAGSVRMAADFLNEAFIVLSGDGICDFDLAQAVAFHQMRGAQATMMLKRHPSPREYGMVALNEDQTVRSFHEKPGRCEVYSDLINTGIYILEPELLKLIPEGASCDFGHDFFPELLRSGVDIHGCIAEGYWCDVGDVAAYLKVHRDAMDGRIGVINASDTGISPDAAVEPGAVIEKPCCIAPGARISCGAHIGPYSVIGENALVEGGAQVKRSIVSRNARIGEGTQLRDCIVGRNAVVESEAQLYEESVAGAFSRIGSRAVMVQGVKLWPYKALPEGERPMENVVWGAKREHRFVTGKFPADEPVHAARFAQAMTAELNLDDIIIGCGASSVADAMARAVISGAMAQGALVYDAGICSLPQLRHAQRGIRAACAAFVDEAGVTPLDSFGAILPEKKQRAVLRAIERQDYSGAFSGITKPAVRMGDTSLAYIAQTAALFRADPKNAPKILLTCENSHVMSLAEQVFRRAGMDIRSEVNIELAQPDADEIRVEITLDGEKCFVSADNTSMDEALRQIMCAWTLLRMGERRLILALSATSAIETLCARENADTMYIAGDKAAWCAAMAEQAPMQFRIQLDGVACALGFLSALTECGISLKQWKTGMPQVYRSYKRIRMDEKQGGAALHSLFESRQDAQLGGGIRLNDANGWAWISPDDVQPEMCVMAEAARHETADELCFFYAGQLEKLAKRSGD